MILILKTGSALASISSIYGDFEDWIIEKMQLIETEFYIHSTENYETLPPEQLYSGIVITGSPLMVNDIKLKESNLCNWLLNQQKSGTPILGICFGHQLLAVINGGSVGYNNTGTIIGSAKTHLTLEGQQDRLLGGLPPAFDVYKSHQQSIHKLPESAEILAVNNSGIIDAVRFNANSWGLQFHPEFDFEITTLYIQEKSDALSADGFDVQALLQNVVTVDYGNRILKRFKEISINNISS
ncbi:MAG: glutamine amidotransferase [Bacteroidetes bacterium]|nr:glutamine amidotransferase [Bacteroidota bacterium]